jgi:hypothetical protein
MVLLDMYVELCILLFSPTYIAFMHLTRCTKIAYKAHRVAPELASQHPRRADSSDPYFTPPHHSPTATHTTLLPPLALVTTLFLRATHGPPVNAASG